MTFPDTKFTDIAGYTDAYFEIYAKASASVDRANLAAAADILLTAYKAKKTLYVCGNGGSAAISNHLACDHGKLLATDTNLLPRVQSLATNVEVITAIANDAPPRPISPPISDGRKHHPTAQILARYRYLVGVRPWLLGK
jgi:D-sedoheptulose 7-phosphate isomerase